MTGGFFAKFYVFSAALQANLVGLTIIGVLNSAVGAYYYLRIIVMIYMREGGDDAPVPRFPPRWAPPWQSVWWLRCIWASCLDEFWNTLRARRRSFFADHNFLYKLINLINR